MLPRVYYLLPDNQVGRGGGVYQPTLSLMYTYTGHVYGGGASDLLDLHHVQKKIAHTACTRTQR